MQKKRGFNWSQCLYVMLSGVKVEDTVAGWNRSAWMTELLHRGSCPWCWNSEGFQLKRLFIPQLEHLVSLNIIMLPPVGHFILYRNKSPINMPDCVNFDAGFHSVLHDFWWKMKEGDHDKLWCEWPNETTIREVKWVSHVRLQIQ